MSEDEAQAWVRVHFGADALERIATLVEWIAAENEIQNLIAPSTIAAIWDRHVVDSLQLVRLAQPEGTWLDVGTGAGFPGLVVAIVRSAPMILVEPRRRRVEFLQTCVDRLGLDHVTVCLDKVERVAVHAEIISARAVGSIENLLRAAHHCATPTTRWLLPRGHVDPREVAQSLSGTGWMFHVEQSLTQPDSSIIVLERR